MADASGLQCGHAPRRETKLLALDQVTEGSTAEFAGGELWASVLSDDSLYTPARTDDVGNQLLRHSGGAAEDLVRSGLTRAIAPGEVGVLGRGRWRNRDLVQVVKVQGGR